MQRKTFQLFIILATVSLVGVIIIQIFWVTRAFDLKEKQFSQATHIALKNVAEKILMYNNNPATLVNPVNQVSSNYYTVRVNDVIDAYALELYLKTEFEHRGIFTDFEYGIYDCVTERMVYGNYISKDGEIVNTTERTTLPELNTNNYYFGVHFPKREAYLLNQLDFWIFSSFVLVVVVVFFSYTIFVIIRQKRLSEVQQDFINNMTHEFKTPIATIAISSEVLMQPAIVSNPERLRNYANIIYNENNRLKNQVERVLQIATLDKANIQLHKEEVDINKLVQEVAGSTKLALKQQQGELILDLESSAVIAQVDKVHLTNILHNLLENAIKYSKHHPVITIRTAKKRNGVRLSVEDNGIGISEEAQRLIFDKFYRVPTGDKHDVKGFGLGLYYVKLMVEAHKGTIGLESLPNQGSKFSFFLPYA
ncbi:MAG TPA: two-component sensor histidine kinase [Microscillaceae bacterium]|nr:two-component sensor histidine kinase [Microscillaceae bacterium]